MDIHGLENILNEVKIENNKKQIEHLFKLIDSDKNIVISRAEFEKYLTDYNEKEPISSNILNMNKGKNKLALFQEVLEVKVVLKDTDYFLAKEGYSTILNSDYAALTKCEQLIGKLTLL